MSDKIKLKLYYFTAVLSLVFAVIGFSYNAWRMEVSESNTNVRTASFEVLKELAELERIVFASHYDKDSIKGSPRDGWVKVGLITDLSVLIGTRVEAQASLLKETWSTTWETLPSNEKSTINLVQQIDLVRLEIKRELSSLK
ncbi:MAG: hypothetical protein MI867_28680 [Pseudomonadales bacterium]|nr:hypothetical protein [Pseudomonadales bacterium]